MPQPRRLTLSVIFPTLRFDLGARQMLTAAAMAGSKDIQVLIGDNRVDPDKWTFLENPKLICAHVHMFCHTNNIGAQRNYIFLLGNATSDLICLAADDDFVSTDYFTAAASILADEPDIAIASGLPIAVT
jgi:hypothetical protein